MKKDYLMKTITIIGEKELLSKISDGVTKNAAWEKPLLLLTQNGDDYVYLNDAINEQYKTRCITSEPYYNTFEEINGRFECLLNGNVVDDHHPEVDVYKYLGCSYAVAVHRYCVDYFKYEGKPVVSFVCVSDKDCEIENIPAWIYEEFEVILLQLNY